jgi:hypothetical protein
MTNPQTEPDEITARRFGRNHDRPCNDPNTLTCSFYECQKCNECQKDAEDEQN